MVCLLLGSSFLGLAGSSTWSCSRKHYEGHQLVRPSVLRCSTGKQQKTAALRGIMEVSNVRPVRNQGCRERRGEGGANPVTKHLQHPPRGSATGKRTAINSPLAAYQLSMIRLTLPDDAGNIKLTVAVLTVPSGNR